MNTIRRDPALLGLLLFVLVSSGAVVVVANVYSAGAHRVDSDALSYPALRVLARPLSISVGQAISQTAIVDHLLRIGYTPAPTTGTPATYVLAGDHLSVTNRYPEFKDVTIQWKADAIAMIVGTTDRRARNDADLEPEELLTFEPDGSTGMLQSAVPYLAVHGSVLEDALVASEDKQFWTHHGLDFARLAFVPVLGGGASTLTMQLARLNVLQDRSRTIERKTAEIGVAMALERSFSKQALLGAYVNSAYLGTSRGRQVHGFAAAAREFFGVTSVRALDLTQAATLVALLNQPARYLNSLRAGDDALLRQQRNRVFRLMNRRWPDRYDLATVANLEQAAVVLVQPGELGAESGLEVASQWYLDSISSQIPRDGRTRTYTSLDPQLQRIAQRVVHDRLSELEDRHPSTRGRLQAALVAVDPETGDLLAMTGGKSHDQSQFNRATSARRQVGSLIKAFDLAAALERGVDEGRTDLTPASTVADVPTTFSFGGRRWTPSNYGHQYSGPISWRRAIALSRNVPAVKIAEAAGFDRVARLWWKATGIRESAIYPSISLGATEAAPVELAMAYSVFANGGIARPLRSFGRTVRAGREVPPAMDAGRQILRPEVAFVVADTLRGPLDEGTAVAARTSGFAVPAAGKTGTTDDTRDSWFVGFTPRLLVVVWVGADDNQPTGLTGAQGALPIWVSFMKAAIDPKNAPDFAVPPGVLFAQVDSVSGHLATTHCPHRVRQAFVAGTEPRTFCSH
jgi:penicillin-binding protein 1B